MEAGRSVALKADKVFKYSQLTHFNFHFGQVSNTWAPVPGRKYIYLGVEYNTSREVWGLYFVDASFLADFLVNRKRSAAPYKLCVCHCLDVKGSQNAKIDKARIERLCERHNITVGPIDDIDNVIAEMHTLDKYGLMPYYKPDVFTRLVGFNMVDYTRGMGTDLTEYMQAEDTEKLEKKLNLLGARQDVTIYKGRVYGDHLGRAYNFLDSQDASRVGGIDSCYFKSGSTVWNSGFAEIKEVNCNASFLGDTYFCECEIFINEPCIIYKMDAVAQFERCTIHVNAPCLIYGCIFEDCKLLVNSDIAAKNCRILDTEIFCSSAGRKEP